MQRHLPAALLALLLVPASLPSIAAAGALPKPAVPGAKSPASTLTAILLVAQDPVSDPNFGGSIVVVMNNLAPAPVGLIINRPTSIAVSRLFPKLKRLAQVHDRIYFGGPVELRTVWFLFRAKTAPETAIRVCDGVYVSSSQKLLLKLLGRSKPMQGLRIFVGHAGWYPGQLQTEIEGGAWAPKRADADSIFNPKPQLPWPSQPGSKGGT
ncbi:MAG: YqgE/AlgH family protein [Steroidobacteraceae bacterium]